MHLVLFYFIALLHFTILTGSTWGFTIGIIGIQIKKTILLDDRFYLVTHVNQNWKPLLEGLEQIDIAFDELLDIEGL